MLLIGAGLEDGNNGTQVLGGLLVVTVNNVRKVTTREVSFSLPEQTTLIADASLLIVPHWSTVSL